MADPSPSAPCGTKTTSGPLARIRLEPPPFPNAGPAPADCGYELIAPLDPDGYLDTESWLDHRAACHARPFGSGMGSEQDRLIYTCKRRWILLTASDGRVRHIATHRFVEGGSIVVAESDGTTRSFRVARLQPLMTSASDT